MGVDQMDTREEKVALALMYEFARVSRHRFIDEEFLADCPFCKLRHSVTGWVRPSAKCWGCKKQFRLDWSGVEEAPDGD